MCGIGFTMSLFIGELAFPHAPALIREAKLGILLGSFVAAVLGFLVLRLAPARRDMPDEERRIAHEIEADGDAARIEAEAHPSRSWTRS